MLEIIRDNISAIFALMGILLGFFGNWLLTGRDFRFKLLEKVLDKRITAYENILECTKVFRIMVPLEYSESELIRYPAIFEDSQTFSEFIQYFNQTISTSSSWLSTDLTCELNLFQDYIVNLHRLTLPVEDAEKLKKIGVIVKDDFINFSTQIEKLAHRFFRKELPKLRLNTLDKWHKYAQSETISRLNETQLFIQSEAIKAIVHG